MAEGNQVYMGICEWFNKAYGFIKPDIEGADLFCHYSDLTMEGYKTLKKGQRVSFEIGENKRGQPKAINVQVLPSKE